jgi:hypothetical protein
MSDAVAPKLAANRRIAVSPSQPTAARSHSSATRNAGELLQQRLGNKGVQSVLRTKAQPPRVASTAPVFRKASPTPRQNVGDKSAPGAQAPARGTANAPAVRAPEAKSAIEGDRGGGEAFLTAPEIAVGGAAAAALARIDSNAAAKKAAVLARAGTQIQDTRRNLRVSHAGLSSSFLQANGRVASLVSATAASAIAGISATSARILVLATGIIASGRDIANGVIAAIASGVMGATESLFGTVASASESIRSFASSIPLPDIPGLEFVRERIVGVAQGLVQEIGQGLETIRAGIQRLVASAVEHVNSAMTSFAETIASIAASVARVLTEAIQWIGSTLSGFQAQAGAALLMTSVEPLNTVDEIDQSTAAEIEQAQRSAIADIEFNRVGSRLTILEILEFAFGHGDYPADEGVAGFMDRAAETAAAAEFNGALTQAFDFVVQQSEGDSVEIQQEFAKQVADLSGSATAAGNALVATIGADLTEKLQQVWQQLSGLGQRLLTAVTDVVGRVVSALSDAKTRIAAGFQRVLAGVVRFVTAPVQTISQGVQAFAGLARNLFNAIVANITGGGPSTPSFANSPAMVSANAAFALAPAIPIIVEIGEAIAAIIAAIAAVDIAVVLWWVGVIVLILAILALLVYLLYKALTKPRAIPRAKPRAKPRVRRKARRKRSCPKPFLWNPGINRAGALPGILESCAPLPNYIVHGHHSWPMFAGGLPPQPLMGIRGVVHISILHPRLLNPMLIATFGKDGLVSNKTTANALFIAKLRTNRPLRRQVGAALTAFYVAFSSAQCSPGIPAGVYGAGIIASLLALGGP